MQKRYRRKCLKWYSIVTWQRRSGYTGAFFLWKSKCLIDIIYLELFYHQKEVLILAKNIVRYDLLISCPGDVQTEIDLIKDSVEEFNEKFSDTLGLMVQVRYWKSSSFSQSGNKPQELLNNQFVNDCDAAVAVLWTRFGTPTDKYGSGTEEEIEIMLESGKQVFMYFSEKAISPSSIDYEQYEKVNAFRNKYKDRGIYFTYASDDEFRKLFFSHLTKFFLTKKQSEEYENRTIPNLELRGIDEKEVVDESVVVRPFANNKQVKVKDYIERIKVLFSKIKKIEVEADILPFKNQLLATKKVEVNDNVERIIRSIAEQMQIELGEQFFELGGLSENTFGSIPALGKRNLNGSDDEKKKYDYINELCDQIMELLSWAPIEEAYSELKCLYLAVENNGTSIDEDVEVTLIFGKDEIVTLADMPALEDKDAEYLVKECNLCQMFEISRCARYLSYEDSIKKNISVATVPHTPDIFGLNRRNYQEEYAEEFEEALGYEIYNNGNEVFIKLRMDYIKHNSIVAFPAPVLLKKIPSIIKYEIRSRHIAEVISGTINVIVREDNAKEDIEKEYLE